jgi:surfactin synthase thioesterase subunit
VVVSVLEPDSLGRPVPRPGAALRLLCFPHAGGGTAAYVPFARALPEWIELAIVRLPGRETRLREAPPTAIAPLVADLADELGPVLERPYAVFGHSLGALLGFELVHELRKNALRGPDYLFVSGRRAPSLPERDPPIAGLPDDAFLAELQRRYDAIPAAVLAEPDLMALLLPPLRADYELLESYTYEERPPLSCPVAALGGESDPRVTTAELDAWRPLTTGSFTRRLLPGSHFYIQGGEAIAAAAVVSELDGPPAASAVGG